MWEPARDDARQDLGVAHVFEDTGDIVPPEHEHQRASPDQPPGQADDGIHPFDLTEADLGWPVPSDASELDDPFRGDHQVSQSPADHPDGQPAQRHGGSGSLDPVEHGRLAGDAQLDTDSRRDHHGSDDGRTGEEQPVRMDVDRHDLTGVEQVRRSRQPPQPSLAAMDPALRRTVPSAPAAE